MESGKGNRMKRIAGLVVLVLGVFSGSALAFDNTFFSGITTQVASPIGMALSSVITICALILGATVGYRIYKRFTA